MGKFAKFDAEGFPQGFYAEEVHGARMRPVYGQKPEPTAEEPNPLPPVIGVEPNPETLIPADAVEITDEAWMEFLNNQGLRKWVDGSVVEYAPTLQSLTSTDVDREHDRRAALGKTFTVTGYGEVPLEGSLRTQTVLLALKDTARDMQAAGVTAPLLFFTDRDNADHNLTPAQTIDLVDQGKAYMQALHEAKRLLKASPPIPADYADDAHWPT